VLEAPAEVPDDGIELDEDADVDAIMREDAHAQHDRHDHAEHEHEQR
jgi:hypothetical protein